MNKIIWSIGAGVAVILIMYGMYTYPNTPRDISKQPIPPPPPAIKLTADQERFINILSNLKPSDEWHGVVDGRTIYVPREDN